MLEDSTCIMKMERALYGLIESAKLWYKEFTGFLKSLGFLPNTYDPCVLNLDYKGKTYILVFYLDDCFVNRYNPKQLNYLKKIIAEKYGGCRRTNGDVLLYNLGCYLTLHFSFCTYLP